ncbi:DgyrCDS8647 [Dimorphilus gyrociliatus]|uniref:DgyrCDS8647 n=1 Tax=Dimorphilus gyrociliatus TaxID=2664684 RepID=A0A7I8VZW5_9ANNE|nr:DgyrCDS8647 [Dimorphilus gyrociliatus]
MNGTSGVLYGSENFPSTEQRARNIRDPFNDRTSAEIRKFKEQQMEAERDILSFREERKRQILEKENEKKKDLEMLKSYDPWGRPGHGAPKESPRKQKFTEEQLGQHSCGEQRPADEVGVNDDFFSNFGKPGAGAPILNSRGERMTELPADPSIRFQDSKEGKRINEIEVRYREPVERKMNMRKELDQQLSEKIMTDYERKHQERQKDMEHTNHNPFGRPGAGAPNISPRGNPVLGRTKVLSRENQSSLGDSLTPGKLILDDDISRYDPWGKGAGNPVYDEHGDAKRTHRSDKDLGMFTSTNGNNYSETKTLELTKRGGGGEPLRTNSGKITARIPQTMHKSEFGDPSIKEQNPLWESNSPSRSSRFDKFDEPEPIYNPWGKGGAGAPIRDEKGNVVTHVYGKIKKEKPSGHPAELPSLTGTSADMRSKQQAQSQYLDDLRREIDEQKKFKQRQFSAVGEENGDLASVIRRGQVGNPRRDPNTGVLLEQHLGASDVTKEKTNERRYMNDSSPKYHIELEYLAEERKKNREREKLTERQETQEHQRAFNEIWGRPGGGAPNTSQKLSNLDNSLHHPRREHENYQKRMDLLGSKDLSSLNYVRSTVPSTHTNQYDFPSEQRRRPKMDYKLISPYATN